MRKFGLWYAVLMGVVAFLVFGVANLIGFRSGQLNATTVAISAMMLMLFWLEKEASTLKKLIYSLIQIVLLTVCLVVGLVSAGTGDEFEAVMLVAEFLPLEIAMLAGYFIDGEGWGIKVFTLVLMIPATLIMVAVTLPAFWGEYKGYEILLPMAVAFDTMIFAVGLETVVLVIYGVVRWLKGGKRGSL